MINPALESAVTTLRTAVTVMNSGTEPELCPFFGKCDGILVIDADGNQKEFHANEFRTPETLCKLITAVKPDRVVCGYIGEAEKQKLHAAAIDVRVGTCACSIGELFANFCDLPEA